MDFENVRTDGIRDLKGVTEGDSMFVFYSENCKSITLDIIDKIVALKLKYSGFNVKVGTKNALDFQLASYLGYLIGKEGTDANYYIVSDDKGFEVVADFWKAQNISVNCISLKESSPKTPQKGKKKVIPTRKSKVSSKDLATLEEVITFIGKDNEPSEVLKIFNQYKTKVAINNGLAKHFKDSKKASEIYKKLKPLLKSKNKS